MNMLDLKSTTDLITGGGTLIAACVAAWKAIRAGSSADKASEGIKALQTDVHLMANQVQTIAQAITVIQQQRVEQNVNVYAAPPTGASPAGATYVPQLRQAGTAAGEAVEPTGQNG